MAAGGSQRLQRAHAAAHKEGEQRADWKTYMHEQGGAMVGRHYQLRLELEPEAREGRYGPIEVKLPKGVFDIARPGETCTSSRKRWMPKGTWTPETRHSATGFDFALAFAASVDFDPSWTRFNNCTKEKNGSNRNSEKRSTRRNTAQRGEGRNRNIAPPVHGQAPGAGPVVVHPGR